MANLMEIAIIGMSCRLPDDIKTPGDFYRMLCRKRAGWSQVPADRFNAKAYHNSDPNKKGCFNSEGGYFIQDDIYMFDAGFFDITKKEAESMDPAQRLLLECAYEALENAGAPKESVAGKKVGVFIGGNYGEHRVANLRDLDNTPSFDATGNQGAFLAGRLAYYFDLRGPTITVDTACSSSMHALHLAVQSIRSGESEQAIVGASHLITDPDIWASMGNLRLFSADGRTHAFDHRAKSGYARGEGAGCLILKPLHQARADNDHIFSVITHTGISHNGRTVGIVAPCPDAQEKLVTRVLREAGIHPWEVGFFEAHGTGTKKGDPIEARGIYNAVGRYFSPENPLHIGSVKPNVGHLECASGIISIIKGALMLYYGFILPNADFERVNEAIPLAAWNMRVATRQKPWPRNTNRLCINNFGFSGSNSTCVLSTTPRCRSIEIADNGAYSPLRLFVLSANDETALRKSVSKLGIWIEQHAELYQTTMPRNLAYTLCQRRSHLQWRMAVVAGMCSDVTKAINSHEAVPTRAPSVPPKVAFVYTGQGAQWFAMGRELMKTHPVFLDSIKRADNVLGVLRADFTASEELNRDEDSTRVGLAQISQPICTAVQLALTDLFASFGVTPGAVTGHSSGEIGAAYAAGALTFVDAMTIAYWRGQVVIELRNSHPQLRGAMMAVSHNADDIQELVEAMNRIHQPQVTIACVNSPMSVTLSGDEAGIDLIAEHLQSANIFHRKLFVDVAYHSRHMGIIAPAYRFLIGLIEPLDGRNRDVQFFSSLRGCKVRPERLGPRYWVDNLTEAVQFSTSLEQLCNEYSPDILVEIGPHAALKGPILQGIKEFLGPAAMKISYLPTLVRGQDATRTCLETAGQLFLHGYPLNFFEINHNREEAERPELLAALYTYPWSRQRYCYESRITHQHRFKPFPRYDALGTLADWSDSLNPTWRNIIRTEDLPKVREYQASAQTAYMNELSTVAFEIRDLVVSEHLYLMDDQDVEVLVSFQASNSGDKRSHGFKILSYGPTQEWTEHCTGTVTAMPDMPVSERPEIDCGSKLYASELKEYHEEEVYFRLMGKGFTYPEAFRTLTNVRVKEHQVTGVSDLRELFIMDDLHYGAHPGIVESMLQATLFTHKNEDGRPSEVPCLLSSIRHIAIVADWRPSLGNQTAVKATLDENRASSTVELFGAIGNVAVGSAAVSMLGVRFKALVPFPPKAPPRELCFKMHWDQLDEGALDMNSAVPRVGKDTPIFVAVVTRFNENVFNDPFMWSLVLHLNNTVRAGLRRALWMWPVPYDYPWDWSSCFVIIPELDTAAIYSADHCHIPINIVTKILTESRGVMWVTKGAYRIPQTPTVNLGLGLVRTARSERGAVASTLDLDPGYNTSIDLQAKLVVDAFALSVLSENPEAEMEFAEVDGKLVVPRILPDPELNLDVHRSLGHAVPYLQAYEPSRRLQLHRGTDASSPEDLYFEDSCFGVLGADEVEIKVHATALSVDDVTTGTVDEPGATIHRSCAGYVTRIGAQVDDISVGQKVCALTNSPYATYVRASSTSVALLPDGIDMEVAACIPVHFLPVHYAFKEIARVKRFDRVLIQVSGPIGFAALRVAHKFGADYYALVTNDEHQILVETILPSNRVLDARNIHLAEQIWEVTEGRGMDVCLAISGCENGSTWECLRAFGIFVEIKGPGNHKRTQAHLRANTVFASVDMLSIAVEYPEDMKEALTEVVSNFDAGELSPGICITTFMISSLPEGIALIRDGYMAHVVIATQEGDESVMTLKEKSGDLFQSPGTHIIVGGTGGLGRSVAKYMIRNGARTIALLSRSGGEDVIDHLRDEMTQYGADVFVLRCDVSKLHHVRRDIYYCAKHLPPIRGVVHAAMVLRDGLLENMTGQDYYDVIAPKAHGACNLDIALAWMGIKVDYFVAFSSAAGIIGSRGQAAYAAANTFLDSLMESRRHRGLPGNSLDLTAVTGVGYLAENANREREILRNFGDETLDEAEVLALLSAAVRGVAPCQTLTGLKLHLGSDGQWPYFANDARFAYLKAEGLAAAEEEGLVVKEDVSPGEAFRGARSDEEAAYVAARGLAEKLSEVLSVAVEDVDVDRNITSYGLDSLTAIELRNWIAKELRVNLQILELLSSGTLSDLAALIVQKAKS
ncbi:hypothetical protein CHGG_00046 [Chaetomium globosum CBS 148.51]|uniref:Uncharacterized protein n=1 Tax=Chaetomium globosum (strain ATCC 6205 / CBS 148.51 / DSM 1962 / NBRC 6347 / NRRL 1970) TaxID=306901 RepID=Q2HIA8_CHAGB|nr:uncharacterized protein CHGG_00046 [Chaetomium globosum CBS 148.51]EAQ91811.1 hypothetical protein CHGG_00046 [Chaetomium globosum CBS 148.51]